MLVDDFLNGGSGVNDFVGRDARHRGAENHAGHIAAAHEGGQVVRLKLVPNGGDVFDADPVELNVLPVGEVGGGSGIVPGDFAHDAQLIGGDTATVEPNPHHKIFVLQFAGGELACVLATQVLPALGIQPQPFEPGR